MAAIAWTQCTWDIGAWRVCINDYSPCWPFQPGGFSYMYISRRWVFLMKDVLSITYIILSKQKHDVMCFCLYFWSQHCVLLIELWNDDKVVQFLTYLLHQDFRFSNTLSLRLLRLEHVLDCCWEKAPDHTDRMCFQYSIVLVLCFLPFTAVPTHHPHCFFCFLCFQVPPWSREI